MNGSLFTYRLKDGTIKHGFVLELGANGAGKRIQKRHRGFATEQAAKDAMQDEMVDRRRGVHFDPATGTTRDYLERWLVETEGTRSGITQLNHEIALRRHVYPLIGGVPLARLDALMIQAMHRALQGRYAPGTVNRTYRTLRGALRQAVAWGLISKNPSDGVTLPRGKPKALHPIVFWTPAETRQFLAAREAKDPRFALWYFLLDSGCRIGEALALRWRDLDVERNRVQINRTLTRDRKGVWMIGPQTKTAGARRTISLTPRTVALLQLVRDEQRQRRKGCRIWQLHDLIWDRGDGQWMPPSTVSQALDRATRAAKVPRLTPHGLRHTNATTLLLAGEPMMVVSRRLGHTSVAFTIDVYGHVTHDADDSASVTMAGILGAV